jgi:hypothetical protein
VEEIMMQIIEKTDRTLHITDQNRQCLWGLLLAVPFLARTAKVITLECQRNGSNQIECQRNVTGILGTETDRIPGKLISAKIFKTSGKDAVLSTTKGEIELVPYSAFGTDRVNKTVDRLNAFIKDPQQSKISIEQDDRWENSIWGINFLAGGMAISYGALAIPLRMSCRLDRDRGEAILDKKYLLYGDRQIKIPLATIDRSLVARLPFYLNHKPVHYINLIPKLGKKVSFSVPSHDLQQYHQIVNIINNFLEAS